MFWFYLFRLSLNLKVIFSLIITLEEICNSKKLWFPATYNSEDPSWLEVLGKTLDLVGDWTVGDWLVGDWMVDDWLVDDWMVDDFFGRGGTKPEPLITTDYRMTK